MLYQYFEKPQLVIFYASLVLIGAISFVQFDFLITEYWSATNRVSKGPVIWAVSLLAIHLDLSREGFKKTITNLDLLFVLALLLTLGFSLLLDPLIVPTLLVIGVWHLVSGSANVSRLLIVWLFLFFSLPYYSQVSDLLRPLTIIVTDGLIGIAGIPVLVQEYFIAIPEGIFFIAQGCSGVRVMTINLLLLFLYSIMSRFNIYQFLQGLIVAVVIALVANWLRLIIIILFANKFGIDHDFVQDHVNFGWFLYATLLAPYFYLMLKIDKPKKYEFTFIETHTRQLAAIPAFLLLLPLLLIVFWHQWLR